jgi:hypothetical protein
MASARLAAGVNLDALDHDALRYTTSSRPDSPPVGSATPEMLL